jgi:hypothetical protein
MRRLDREEREVGALFLRVLEEAEFLHLAKDIEDGSLYLEMTTAEGQRRRAAHSKPLYLLQEIMGEKEVYPCRGPCQQIKPRSAFGDVRNRGRNPRCKACESKRTSESRKRGKGK